MRIWNPNPTWKSG